MGYQYRCRDEIRRLKFVGPSAPADVYAIDYLEVIDKEALDEHGEEWSPRQQTLVIRFFRGLPDTISKDNVRIEGGVRVTPIKVLWAVRATDADPDNQIDIDRIKGTIPTDAADYFLVIRTDAPGDFSTYRLRLVATTVWPGDDFTLDPILSQVDFWFKVECPSEFDCPPEQVCPPDPPSEPIIDYLAKDYAGFRRLLLDRLSVVMPEWRERNVADIGITLVELLAYAADHLSYYQDTIANEAYLGTARQRISMRRHARLLDYTMHDGCNARAWVRFECDDNTGKTIPADTQLTTKIESDSGVGRTERDDLRPTNQPRIFQTMYDIELHQAHNEMHFYTWGDEKCCLPKGATRATLCDNLLDPPEQDKNRLCLRVGDVLILEEQYDPDSGLEGDPAHRHAVRLTKVIPEANEDEHGHRTPSETRTDPLTDWAIADIEWHEQDALPFALDITTVTVTTQSGVEVREASVARGNVVLADHRDTVEDEEVPLRDQNEDDASVSTELQTDLLPLVTLSKTNVTFRSLYVPYDERRGQWNPATGALIQNPREALPEVRLYSAPLAELVGEPQPWLPLLDLLASCDTATEFVVETTSDGKAHLRFGDEIYGTAPKEKELYAYYSVGNGTAGNVGAEAINQLVSPVQYVKLVCNPMPAQGGREPESIEEVRINAPQAFRTQERAVTEQDYAEVIRRHPDVQKAVGSRRWTGSWHTMFVTVDRKGGRPVDWEFEAELREFLERFRLAGQDVEIDAPRFVPLDILFTVCVAPGYYRADVKEALLEVFSNARSAAGVRRFFHPDNFTFGQPLYLSRLIATAMDVPGVAWVDFDNTPPKPNKFQRWGAAPNEELEKGVLEVARLEIVRLDNDPNARENGKLDFEMVGGM